MKSHLLIARFTSLHVNHITTINIYQSPFMWKILNRMFIGETQRGRYRFEMFGQSRYHLIPQKIPECEFLPTKMADYRNRWSPPSHALAHSHTSEVNIPHKQTRGQTWKSVEGSRHTLGLSPPTPPPHGHIYFLCGHGEWWWVPAFNLSKWQPPEVLLCFLACTVHVLLSIHFSNVSICGFPSTATAGTVY